MYSQSTITNPDVAPAARPMKQRPILETAFTSRSSEGTTLESDSSCQPSSVGIDADSRQEWLESALGSPRVTAHDTINSNVVTLKRKTTKDLIKIFECNEPSVTGTSKAIIPPASYPLRRAAIKPTLNEPLPELPLSNPLRQSFRNLVIAFNKAKKTFSDQHPNIHFKQTKTTFHHPIQSEQGYSTLSTTRGGGLGIPTLPKATISRLVPAISSDIRNGILLYFEDSALGPVWHRCQAFLAPPNLRLHYFTTSGKHVAKVIALKAGIDARSIASTNCASVPPPMLDDAYPHVFELEFADGTTEKFAATSVLERGGWIGAIWDVLIARKGTSLGLVDTGSTLPLSLSSTSANSPFQSAENMKENRASSFKVSSKGQSLPLANTSMSSNWSSTNDSVSASHSIRTLGTMSIVRQRLAVLDNIPSASSSNASLAYATPPRTPPAERKRPTSSALARNITNSISQSTVSDALIQSPIPIRAPPLVSRPSESSRDSRASEAAISLQILEHYEDPVTPEMEFEEVVLRMPREEPPFLLPKIDADIPTFNHQSYFQSPLLEEKAVETARNQKASTFDLQKTMLNLRASTDGHQANLEIVRKELHIMHEDMRTELEKLVLPVLQADDLRERLEALANGLHSVDLHGLHDKIDKLQNKSSEVTLKNEAPSIEDEGTAALKRVEDAMKELASSREHGAEMSVILEKLNAIQAELEARDVPPPVPAKDDVVTPTTLLQEPLRELQSKLHTLEELLTEIKQSRETVAGEKAVLDPAGSEEAPAPALLSVFSGRNSDGKEADEVTPNPVTSNPPQEILDILELAKEEKDHRGSVTNQFADVIRYLNELNNWMEAFVAKTSGNEELLQKIAQTMENVPHASDAPVMNLRNIGNDEGNSSTRSGVAALVSHTKVQEDAFTDLRRSIQDVLASVQEANTQQAELRDAGGLDVILATLERNRREQDELLKTIADGLSTDLRGERIRFVDAMKEATTLNVAAQIEEFKRQMSKEVMVMLQEVGKSARMRERRHLEQEIAEIFDQQVVERQASRMGFSRPVSSNGFQPIPQSLPPPRPTSQGPYPAFMMPPAGYAPMGPPYARPMPLHPNRAERPLPIPTPSVHSTPSPGPQPSSMSIIPTMQFIANTETPIRRKA